MVRTITKEELKSKIDRGEKLRLVDVRDTPDFKQEHIVSAIHLLIAELSPGKAGFMFARYDLIVT